MGEDRTGQPNPTNQRVTVSEAAELLGITAEAVRMRIKRGTLRSERQGGRVFVLLGQSQPTDRPGKPTTLLSEMRSRIQFLEDELQRKDAILLNMTEAMKALSPPSQEIPPDERESPQTVGDEPEMADSSSNWATREQVVVGIRLVLVLTIATTFIAYLIAAISAAGDSFPSTISSVLSAFSSVVTSGLSAVTGDQVVTIISTIIGVIGTLLATYLTIRATRGARNR